MLAGESISEVYQPKNPPTLVARSISNGNDYVGTILAHCSLEFRQAMRAADVIISKGQANYESLESTSEAGKKTFFLLRAKCPAAAEKLGVKLNDMVFRWNGLIIIE